MYLDHISTAVFVVSTSAWHLSDNQRPVWTHLVLLASVRYYDLLLMLRKKTRGVTIRLLWYDTYRDTGLRYDMIHQVKISKESGLFCSFLDFKICWIYDYYTSMKYLLYKSNAIQWLLPSSDNIPRLRTNSSLNTTIMNYMRAHYMRPRHDHWGQFFIKYAHIN